MSEHSKGRMICLEGGEGAGKSTALERVRDWLERRGRKTLVTREPGGTPAAEKIRKLLLDPQTGDIDPMTELLLMFAARRENVVDRIRPALAEGVDVICDRFTDASYAYQGGGRELGPTPVDLLAGLVHPGLTPDLVLVLDVPVEIGLERIKQRRGGPDRFEGGRKAFLERVRNAYLDRARAHPDRYVVVDASSDIEHVGAAIRATLENRLG
ncbi:MAG: dTMP kinase [Wenzhouxiangellaceae bacterium]|nr:dTMP kinase [Wenzhouxiangellaceae bacterium]MBS3746912.1 dTMP kinase [Wenzhouxiangellaceae bacterium]MBS3823796.1 dTMP kinase [Wenzhouxiangellaceae bacterium]